MKNNLTLDIHYFNIATIIHVDSIIEIMFEENTLV